MILWSVLVRSARVFLIWQTRRACIPRKRVLFGRNSCGCWPGCNRLLCGRPRGVSDWALQRGQHRPAPCLSYAGESRGKCSDGRQSNHNLGHQGWYAQTGCSAFCWNATSEADKRFYQGGRKRRRAIGHRRDSPEGVEVVPGGYTSNETGKPVSIS